MMHELHTRTGATVDEAIQAFRVLHELDMKLFGESWVDAAIRERHLEVRCQKK